MWSNRPYVHQLKMGQLQPSRTLFCPVIHVLNQFERRFCIVGGGYEYIIVQTATNAEHHGRIQTCLAVLAKPDETTRNFEI